MGGEKGDQANKERQTGEETENDEQRGNKERCSTLQHAAAMADTSIGMALLESQGGKQVG